MGSLTTAQILQFAGLLISLGVSAVESKAKDEGKSVDDILLEADANWRQAQDEAARLLNEGH